MLAKLNSGLLWRALALVVASLIVSCSSGGGGNDDDDLNGIAPSIFNLSRSAAQAGDEVVISGSNFGASQGNGLVELNDVNFSIASWTDTQIRAVVVPGMTSGVVVVKQNGKVSQSGTNAQLIIGQIVPGTPLLYSITPDYGRRGTDEVVLTGINFGDFAESSGVFFSTDGAGTDVVEATVINDGAGEPKWSNTSITVLVPATAITGNVYVEVNGVKSNLKAFVAQPPPGSGELTITSITPANGPIGTQVDIVGEGFGNQQGGSKASINGMNLPVSAWSNNLVKVIIPDGAVSGPIRVTVGGDVYDSQTFIVANTPVITGVSPGALKIGQPVTVFGKYFGSTQGTGRLNIGTGAPQTVASWNDSQVAVTALPAITGDPSSILVTVTADNGLTSAPFAVTLATSLVGSVNVSPKIGVATKTEFNFNVSVAGGSGNYSYKLFPIGGDTTTTVNGNSLPLKYTYNSKGNYSTSVQVTDNTTGDVAVFLGPTVKVVGVDEIVITSVEPLDFGQIEAAENAWSRWPDPNEPTTLLYNDFVFFGGVTFYTSPFTGVVNGSQELPAVVRDPNKFLGSAVSPRPYAWRRASGGSKIRIRGFNLGDTGGQIWLNSSTPGDGVAVPGANITWPATPVGEEEAIEFTLPAGVADDLSGFVTIQPTGSSGSATSIDPLICSAVVSSVVPATGSDIKTGTADISGFDFVAPQIDGVAGSKTYLFFVVNAQYTDPFTNSQVTQLVNMIYPVDVSADINGALLQFPLSRLDKDGDVSVDVRNDIEHYSADGTQFAVVQDAKLVAGTYSFWFWTGALDSGTGNLIANSGVFSQTFNMKVNEGGGGGGGNNTVSGTVLEDTDDDNLGDTPIAGVTVTIGALSDTTDANGDYSIGGVADGAHTVVPSMANFTFLPASRPVSLPPDATGVDFVAKGGGGGGNLSVSGTVTRLTQDWPDPISNPDAPDEPFPGVQVEVWDSAHAVFYGSGVSDANGNYTVTNLPEDLNGVFVFCNAADVDEIGLPIGGEHFLIPFDVDYTAKNFLDKNGFLIAGN
ncbi:IPT/TIG domain-containing protein [bacterium]|nr:IPT/TIG domain-containing protein [bacterium]